MLQLRKGTTSIAISRRCYNLRVPIGHSLSQRRANSSSNSSTGPITEPWTSNTCPTRPGRREPSSTIYRDVAVLGGGISGLAAAYSLKKHRPDLKVTLYEASDHLGGWLKSKHHTAQDGSTFVFESGPRTLRPGTLAGEATLRLALELGLEDEILFTSKRHPSAQNRYIYYPDHLVRMPGPGREVFDQLWTVMTEPIFKGIMEAIFEWGREPRPAKLRDESIGQFFERRLGGPDLPDNILSAVLHGIYSGDVHRLSMKTLLPLLWHAEQEYGSVTAYVRQILGRKATLTRADMMAGCKIPVEDNVSGIKRNASVYSFKGGIQTLSDALWNALEEMGVTIKTDYPVQSIKYDGTKGGKVGVISAVGDVSKKPGSKVGAHDHIISSLPWPALKSALSNHSSDPDGQKGRSGPGAQVYNQLKPLDVPYSTVMVANLYYPSPPHVLLGEHQGFGYLIPNSVAFELNPEQALGVVFDSLAVNGQDSARGTKLTVMLGGEYWRDLDRADLPTTERGAEMAAAVVRRHLNITEEPEVAQAVLHHDAIPQYEVGHLDTIEQIHEALAPFQGRLSVVSNWTGLGVGVNDCVFEALCHGKAVANSMSTTGLETAVHYNNFPTKEWVWKPMLPEGKPADSR